MDTLVQIAVRLMESPAVQTAVLSGVWAFQEPFGSERHQKYPGCFRYPINCFGNVSAI